MRILLTITLICSPILIWSQIFEASLASDSMRIGEHNIIFLTLKDKFSNIPENGKFQSIEKNIGEKIEILQSSPDQKEDIVGTDSVLFKKAYKITVFDSGYYAIPPFKFQWNDTVKTSNALLLTVKTVPVDTSKGFVDIKGIYLVEYTFADRWEAFKNWAKENWILLTAIGVALIAIIIILILLTRPKEKVEIIIQRPAHELAFERLQILEEKELWKQGKDKEYYSELTNIVRKYLEDRYNVRAMEQTTAQIRNSFKWVNISDALKSEMITLLQLADLVKFAKEKPIDTDNMSSIDRVRKFINDTKLTPEEQKHKDNDK